MILRSANLLRLLLPASLALLFGCSLKQNAPVKSTFLVEAARPGESRPRSNAAMLRVRSLSIAPPYEERGFVYRISELGYESDFYREFLVTPRAMLTEEVRQWLDASGLFSAVIESASKADQTHSLEGHVSALYADLRDKTAPKAILSIEFYLLHHRAGVPEIVLRRRFHQETPAEDRNPEALAKAWSRGLAQILGALEAELANVKVE